VVRAVGTFTQLMESDLSFRTLMTAYGHGAGGGSGENGGGATPSAERAAAAAGKHAKQGQSSASAATTPTTTNTASTAADKSAVAIPVAAASAVGGKATTVVTVAGSPAPVDAMTKAGGAAASVAAANALPPSKSELMSAEEKNEGAVQFRYYVRYFRAAGFIWTTVIVLLCAYSASQFAQLLSQWWLAVWSSDTSYLAHTPGFYQGIYVVIGVGAALFAFLRVVTMSLMGIRASRRLHADLLTTILRAPLSFFDTTPLGRVLVRFSKDTDAVDNALVMNMGMLGMCIFFVAGSLAAIIFATPWFAIAVVPILVIYVYVNNYFRNAARETKRFDSITRSPIFAHFSESLNGMTTIRAYGLVERFAAENELRISANINAWYSLRSCDRWLSVRLESLGAFIILVAALLAVGTARSTSGSTGQSAAGLSGFSLSYAIAVTGLFTWLLRTFAETEQQLNSVERIAYYTDSVPQEPYEQPPQHAAPPAGWPSAGAIEMAGYRMRYRDNTPEVLHGVTVSIKGGMRVGIVGRTGAGKSSMTQALFRLVTDDCHSGRIAIDGVDIDTVGLSRLRSNMAIIPQVRGGEL
jgi:ABC-type multidrug transport system fused ATPase/permease subunit